MRGLYGFRLAGLDDGASQLPSVPAQWPLLTVVRRHGVPAEPAPPGTFRVGDRHAELWLAEAGRIDISRDPLRVRFTTRERLTADAILHPFLGLPCAIAAGWLGRAALHGGAVVLGERAFALLGDREAGKSSTLGRLLADGHPVLADDIVVADGTEIFAGPACIDLRPEAAALLGGDPLGVVGNRDRWRLRPRPIAASAALGGLVELCWGPRIVLEPLSAEERLRLVIAASALRADATPPLAVLELAGLPGWRFTRPRDLDRLAQSTAQLVAGLTSA